MLQFGSARLFVLQTNGLRATGMKLLFLVLNTLYVDARFRHYAGHFGDEQQFAAHRCIFYGVTWPG